MSTEKATENSGFLDGRDYTAAFIYEFCALLVGNGVYAGELAPTATNENMTITHGSGHAWINGVWYRNKTPFVLDIATADGALNRYDSLMLRLDLSANETYATIVQGEYATAPTPPACTRNAEIYDLKICDIYVPAGCTKITQDLITDTRMDASVCGVPVFPVDHLDLTTFYKQVAADLANFRAREQADFAAWVTGQEESHLATMRDLVELVRITSENSRAEILELLRQLNELLDGDTVGELIAAINEKLPRSGGDLTGDLQMGGHKVTSLAEPTESTDAATKNYADKMLPLDGSKPMTGHITMGGNKITDMAAPTSSTDAATMGYVDTAVSKAAPYNLLHNSDFMHFVAQAGIGGLHGTQAYAGDRWILVSGTVTGERNANGDGYKNITLNGTIRQTVANPPEGDYVLGCDMVSGTAEIAYSDGAATITSAGGVIRDAGLYNGKMLPKYQPRGYTAELSECMRYSYRLSTGNVYSSSMPGHLFNATTVRMTITLPVEMRLKPTVSIPSGNLADWKVFSTGGVVSPTAYTVAAQLNNRAVTLTLTIPSKTTQTPAVVCIYSDIEFNADL